MQQLNNFTATPLQSIPKVNDIATIVTEVTTTEDEKNFEDAVGEKMAIALALDMRIAAAVKADRRSRQQALNLSPAAYKSGLQFPCCC